MPDKDIPPVHRKHPDPPPEAYQAGQSSVEKRKGEQRTGEVEASPICPVCFALVSNVAGHVAWHESMRTPPTTPPRPETPQNVR